MKKLFFTLCAAVISMVATAQDDLVATLSHGDNIKSYYGVDALSEAYEDAVDGDIITLSAGTFNAYNISKAITLRGAGMWTETQQEVTIINNQLTWNMPAETTITPTVEGIDFKDRFYMYGNNATQQGQINKCRFRGAIELKRGTFTVNSCLIENSTIGEGYSTGAVVTTAYCSNSKLRGISTNNGRIFATNCFICDFLNISNSTITNSIISGSLSLNASGSGSNNILKNSVGLGYNGATDLFDYLGSESTDNILISQDCFSIFKNGDVRGGTNLELTDDAAALYLGSDGTQVGVYGGAYPFDPTITAPKVRKMVLNQQVNSNGKLGVTIEVE
jgi:hypothetical protein